MLARRSFAEMHQVLKSGVVRIRFRPDIRPSDRLISVNGEIAASLVWPRPDDIGRRWTYPVPGQGTISDMITLPQESASSPTMPR